MLVLVLVFVLVLVAADVSRESRMISIAASNTAGMNVAAGRATHCLPTPHIEHIAPHTPPVVCIQLQLSHCVRTADAADDDDADVDAAADDADEAEISQTHAPLSWQMQQTWDVMLVCSLVHVLRHTCVQLG